MGREIRMVPPDWEHPKYTEEEMRRFRGPRQPNDDYHPLRDEDYDEACEEWYREAAAFKPTEYARYYHEEEGDPPDEKYYRHRKWTAEEATHYQIYETVSEGTPVTPHFATKEELIEYLVVNGDYWDQHRGDGGWSREAAERFVESGWAPSMITIATPGKPIEILQPRDMKDLK